MDDGLAVFMIHFNGHFDEENCNVSSYIGGETRILRVPYNSGFDDFCSKLHNRIGTNMSATKIQVKCRVTAGRYMNDIMIDIRDDEDLQGIFEMFKNTSISLGIIYVSKCSTNHDINSAQPISRSTHHMSIDNEDTAVKDTDHVKMQSDFPVCDNNIEPVTLNETLSHTPERTFIPTNLECTPISCYRMPNITDVDDANNQIIFERGDDQTQWHTPSASDDFPSHNEGTPIHYYQVDNEEVGDTLHTSIDVPHVRFPQRPRSNVHLTCSMSHATRTEGSQPDLPPIPNDDHSPKKKSNAVPGKDINLDLSNSDDSTDCGSSSDDDFDFDDLENDGLLRANQSYASKKSFLDAVREHAIRRNFEFRIKYSCPYKVGLTCVNIECQWGIHASIHSGRFTIRTFNPSHTCCIPARGSDHRQATTQWIVDQMASAFRRQPEMTAASIQTSMHDKWRIHISYRKAYRAKEKLLCLVHGSYESSFKSLPTYKQHFLSRNPGSYFQIEKNLYPIGQGDLSFIRVFWTIGPCLTAFVQHMRPLISMDGTHLRGKYPGALLIACGFDGNNRTIPFAYAVVSIENYENWEWFLDQLRSQLGERVRNLNLTFLSDRQKGLKKAVPKVFPEAYHRFCMQHLQSNFHSTFKDVILKRMFWSLSKLYRSCDFTATLSELGRLNPAAHKWICDVPNEHWSNAFFIGRSYGVITTNPSESLNSIFKSARTYPIVKLIEFTVEKAVKYWNKYRNQSTHWNGPLTRKFEKRLDRLREVARDHQSYRFGEFDFQVHSAAHTDTVDLQRRTCTCRAFQVLEFPCSHAMAALSIAHEDPYQYCGAWYLLSTYKATYSQKIYPTLDEKQWEPLQEEVILNPPTAVRQAGRPKTIRIRSEFHDGPSKKCSYCKQIGHNKRSCKNPPPVET